MRLKGAFWSRLQRNRSHIGTFLFWVYENRSHLHASNHGRFTHQPPFAHPTLQTPPSLPLRKLKIYNQNEPRNSNHTTPQRRNHRNRSIHHRAWSKFAPVYLARQLHDSNTSIGEQRQRTTIDAASPRASTREPETDLQQRNTMDLA